MAKQRTGVVRQLLSPWSWPSVTSQLDHKVPNCIPRELAMSPDPLLLFLLFVVVVFFVSSATIQ